MRKESSRLFLGFIVIISYFFILGAIVLTGIIFKLDMNKTMEYVKTIASIFGPFVGMVFMFFFTKEGN